MNQEKALQTVQGNCQILTSTCMELDSTVRAGLIWARLCLCSISM